MNYLALSLTFLLSGINLGILVWLVRVTGWLRAWIFFIALIVWTIATRLVSFVVVADWVCLPWWTDFFIPYISTMVSLCFVLAGMAQLVSIFRRGLAHDKEEK